MSTTKWTLLACIWHTKAPKSNYTLMNTSLDAVQVIISTVDSKMDLLPVHPGYCNVYFCSTKIQLEQLDISIVTDHLFINFPSDSWQISPLNAPANIITLSMPISIFEALIAPQIAYVNNQESVVILPTPAPSKTIQYILGLVLKPNGIALQSLRENKCKLVEALIKALSEQYVLPSISTSTGSLTAAPPLRGLSIMTLMDFIYENYILNHNNQQVPNASEIAKKMRISPALFRVEFKKAYGKTLYQAYIDKKMEYAKTLLAQGLKAIEVSRITGYSSPIKFSKQFQKHFNTTPYQYKKMAYQP